MEKNRLKIGLFIDTFFPMIDGVVVAVDNFAKYLSNYADVVVFCPKGKTNYDDGKFPYKVIRSKAINVKFYDYTLGLPQLDSKFKKQLENSNLDIVHINSPFMLGKIGVKYAKKHNIPVVATMHSQFKRDFQRAVKNPLIVNILLKKTMSVFNKCDICYGVNEDIRKLFVDEYGLKTKSAVQSNGTDMVPINNVDESNNYINKKYSLKSDDIVFLFVGRINLLKNILFLVESLKIVKKRLNFKMIFVGQGPDEKILRQKIKELSLEDNIIMTGKIVDRNEMAKIYCRADLFLFPSLYDASSLVQIEAASQKTPTIFIEGAKTAGTIKNDINGIIAKNNIEDYADKIIKIMTDKNYYDKISEGAYRDLYITWEMCSKQLYSKYLDALKDFK
jgi:1,2-diacylglycerol 3-alpha-glucosyltransferase